MPKYLCMEIGTSLIRFAEVTKTPKSVEVTKIHVFNTPDDAMKDGKIRLQDNIIAAIKDELYDKKIKTQDVYFVVDSTKILFKQVELPVVPKNKIQKMLTLSFTDIFPVDETLYHISYVLKKTYEKNGQKVMALDVFAIPNDLSESYYNLSVALGLNAKGLTCSNRGMISLFPEPFKNRNIAMVNIGENLSTLAITIDGDMVFNKTVPHGVGEAIKQIINSPLTNDGIGVTEAVELLYDQNILMQQLPSEMPEDVTDEYKLRWSVTASIVSFIKSIEATFAQFLSKENISIDEFHLSGLGAGFAGISQLLSYEFGISSTIVQQGGNLSVSESANDLLLLSCYPCIGAALDKANFFSEEEQAGGEIAQKKRIDRSFIFFGTIIFLIAFGYGSYSWLQASMAHQDAYGDNVRLTKRVQELSALGAEKAFNEYSTAVSYNKEVMNLYNKTQSGNEDMVVFLEELERTLPASCRTMSISLNPTTATVSFQCESKSIAAGVLHLLRNLKTTNSMDCAGVAEIETTGAVAFTCTFKLKPTAQRESEGNKNNQSSNNNSTNNNNNNTGPAATQKLLAERIAINTSEEFSTIKLGEKEIDLRTVVIKDLADMGYVYDSVFNDVNVALSLSGAVYTLENSPTIKAVVDAKNNGIFAISVDSEEVLFYNDVHVGMTEEEVIAAINNPKVRNRSGYIMMKNATNTLVMHVNSDTGVIDRIYLLNNTIFTEEASE